MKHQNNTKASIRKKSFDRTMDQARTHMSNIQKAFSKIIHYKTVDSLIEIIANTIARPVPVLAGSVCMLLALLIIYPVSKNIGYDNSGLEGLAGFAIGWSIGVIIDIIRLLLPFQKHSK